MVDARHCRHLLMEFSNGRDVKVVKQLDGHIRLSPCASADFTTAPSSEPFTQLNLTRLWIMKRALLLEVYEIQPHKQIKTHLDPPSAKLRSCKGFEYDLIDIYRLKETKSSRRRSRSFAVVCRKNERVAGSSRRQQ